MRRIVPTRLLLLLTAAVTALCDSTRVGFAKTLPDGLSHETMQQAVITYGKIGTGNPLDRSDTLFLSQHDPTYLRVLTHPRLPTSRPN